MRFALALAALVLVAACERKPRKPVPDPDVAAPAVMEVAAADAYGEQGAAVADVAFWSHPTVAFESLLIVATAESIAAFRIETGEQIFEAPGGAEAVEVFYAGEGEGAPGYLIAADRGAYRLYAIDKDGAGFGPIEIENAAAPAGVFCASGGLSPAIFEAAGGRLSARALTIAAGGADFADARPVAEAPDVIGCHVDPLTDEIVTVSGDGAIRRVDPATGAVFGLALPQDLSPSASGAAFGRTETGEAQGQVALLDSRAGVVNLFDLKDGRALGAVRIKATFDLEAVQNASRITVGSANYGGVYRDGALAVVTSGDGAPVRLVPWNGVMGVLSLPVPAAIDPRAPDGPAAEEAVISIDVIEP